MSKPAAGLFIAGTNTEVGKTFVASQIARCLVLRGKKVGVYKPVASGCRQVGDEIVADDAMALWEAAGKPLDLEAVCPQRFIKPVAPHLAAKAEHRVASFQQMIDGIRPWSESDIVIVEGAGGLLSPISDDRFCADLAIEFGFPIVIVAANRLGVINETGVAIRFATAISVLGEQSLFLALVLSMCGALILGMGLPTLPAYLIIAIMIAPAIIKAGVLPLAAHMFVLAQHL